MTIGELLEELEGLDPSTLVVLEQPPRKRTPTYCPAADTVQIKLVRNYHCVVLKRSEWPNG